MTLLKTIAANIKERRRELGLSQDEVAIRMDMARQNYGRLESGSTNFRVGTLADLSTALEIEIVELLKERDQNG